MKLLGMTLSSTVVVAALLVTPARAPGGPAGLAVAGPPDDLAIRLRFEPGGAAGSAVHHRWLYRDGSAAGHRPCGARETTWRSRLGPGEVVVLCLPAGWDGRGEIRALLGVTSRFQSFGWLLLEQILGLGSTVYTGQKRVAVRGAGGSVAIDVPDFPMVAMGLGSMAEVTGMQALASVHGTLHLNP
jgi:hypothetical protein